MPSTHSEDYVHDVHMEIKHEFFPLPSIVIPNIMINQPSVTEYNFESERKAIADYEKNKAALTVKEKEMKTVREPDAVYGLYIREGHLDGILEPSRIVATTSQPQNAKPVKPALNAFEEFELKPNLFDLLELSTIDDKAALEQILANTQPRVSPNVVESNAQSSSGFLPSSSIPGMDLKISNTDDARNLYNLSTLKNYNNSFGIGVPGASFRQNL